MLRDPPVLSSRELSTGELPSTPICLGSKVNGQSVLCNWAIGAMCYLLQRLAAALNHRRHYDFMKAYFPIDKSEP